jgi:hypothetical protein
MSKKGWREGGKRGTNNERIGSKRAKEQRNQRRREDREFVCLFVVYLTTLFQYLRLYSIDFYSILIRLPSSSEAGETRVKRR